MKNDIIPRTSYDYNSKNDEKDITLGPNITFFGIKIYPGIKKICEKNQISKMN
jgi:hypothetical protein